MTLGGFPLAETQVATVIFLFWALATMVGVVNVMRVMGRAAEEEEEAIKIAEFPPSRSCSLNRDHVCLLFENNLSLSTICFEGYSTKSLNKFKGWIISSFKEIAVKAELSKSLLYWSFSLNPS